MSRAYRERSHSGIPEKGPGVRRFYLSSRTVILSITATALVSCATVVHYAPAQPPNRPASESWDQANLKAHDHGCPTSIFIAPGGNLVECSP